MTVPFKDRVLEITGFQNAARDPDVNPPEEVVDNTWTFIIQNKRHLIP